ncbi:MAG: hypothetical protein ACYCTL_05330 [Acidimicrobiales bacterium]
MPKGDRNGIGQGGNKFVHRVIAIGACGALPVLLLACGSAAPPGSAVVSPGNGGATGQTGLSKLFGIGLAPGAASVVAGEVSALRSTGTEAAHVTVSGGASDGATVVNVQGGGDVDLGTGEGSLTLGLSSSSGGSAGAVTLHVVFTTSALYIELPQGSLPSGYSWVETRYSDQTAARANVPWLVGQALALDPEVVVDEVGLGERSVVVTGRHGYYSAEVDLTDAYLRAHGPAGAVLHDALSGYLTSGASESRTFGVGVASGVVSKLDVPDGVPGRAVRLRLHPLVAFRAPSPPPPSRTTSLSSLMDREGSGGDSDGDG